MVCLLRLWCSRRSGSRVGGAAGGVVVSPAGIGVGEIVENLKRYWWVGVCLWALLAFVSWHYDSTCGIFLSSACLSQYWEGVRWIALLRWVSPYQTLIAGVFAVAGGAFALIAARHSTATALALEDAKNKRSAAIACSIVGDEFRDAAYRASQNYVGAGLAIIDRSSPFVQTNTFITTLHAVDPMLGSIVSAQRRDIEEALSSRSIHDLYRTLREARAKSYVVWHLLLSVAEQLDQSGRFDLSNGEKFSPGDLPNLLKRDNVDPKTLVGLYGLFDWPET